MGTINQISADRKNRAKERGYRSTAEIVTESRRQRQSQAAQVKTEYVNKAAKANTERRIQETNDRRNSYFRTAMQARDDERRNAINAATDPVYSFIDEAKNDPDYLKYAQMGSEVKNPSLPNEFYDIRYQSVFGNQPFAPDITNKAEYARGLAVQKAQYNTDEVGGPTGVNQIKPEYLKMSDVEIGIYNYYLGKYGEDKADAYLDEIDKLLKERLAQEIADDTKDSALQSTAISAAAGTSNAITGFKQLGSRIMGNTESVERNVIEDAYPYITQDLSGGKKVAADMAYSIGNMIPSVAIGGLTGSPAAGAITMGLGTAGSQYQREREKGTEDDKAIAYSLINGALEGGLQYALGGIGTLGKGGFSKLVSKTPIAKQALSKIDDVIKSVSKNPSVIASLKGAGNLALKMNDEGFEEYLQEIIDPVVRNVVLDENNEVKAFSEQALYSYMLGALTGGLFDAPGTVAQITKDRSVLKASKNAQKTVEAIQQEEIAPIQKAENDLSPNESLLAYQTEDITQQEIVNIPTPKTDLKTKNTRALIGNKEVIVKGVSASDDGNLKVNIETDEQTITDDIENVQFMDDDIQNLYNSASRYQTNGAKAYTYNYDGSLSVDSYQKAFDSYYDAGLTDTPIENVKSLYGDMLPEPVRMNAYYAGVNDSNIVNITKPTKGKGGVVKSAAALKMETGTRKALDLLGRKAGVEIVITDTLAEGRANGVYQKGKVYIALDSENPYINVAKHEITHALQEYSPVKYKAYKDFVVSEINKTNPKAYDELIEKTISQYSTIGQSITRSDAMDEVVADATEMFLTDTDAINRLVEQDKSLAEKVLEIVREVINSIQKTISSTEPRTKAAKTLNENLETAIQAEQLWIEALSGTSIEKETSEKKAVSYSLKDSEGRQLSKAQAEYFKDSKVVDSKGNLQVVYHGTNNEFTVFNKSNSKEGNGAFWLSKSLDYAEEMANVKNGERIIEAYVNITNPLYAKLTPNEFSNNIIEKPFIEQALNEGYDGVIIEADTDNEILNETFYAVFDSYQIKSADNINPTNNSDIRYQLKDVDPVEYNNALKENKKLKEINILLEEQFTLTKELKPNRKQIQRISKEILEKTNSSYPAETLAENLEIIWKFNSEHPGAMDTEEAIEAINGISTMILKKSKFADKTLVEQYKPLLETIKNASLILSQKDRADMASEGGIVQFRKKYAGKIRIVTEKGIPVDTFYMELTEKYPEFFPDTITHPADQLIKIADTIDFIKPVYYNPYGMSMEESARDLTNEIITSVFFDIKEAPPTFADKQRIALNKARMRYNQKVKELHNEYKARYNDRLTKIQKDNQDKIAEIIEKSKTATEEQKAEYREQIKALRDQNLQKLKAQQERYIERMKTARDRRERSIEANKYKAKIMAITKELSDMLLKGTEKKHLPKGFAPIIRDVCLTLDFETGGKDVEPSKAALKWRKLKDAYSKLQYDEESPISGMYYENVETSLGELAAITETKRVNQLKYEELEQVYEIMKHIKRMVTEGNKTFAQNLKDSYEATALSVIDHLSLTKPYTQKNIVAKLPIIDSFAEMLNKGNIKPYYFFKKIGGDFERLFTNIRNAEDVFVKDFEEGNKFAHEMEKKYDYKSWDDDKPTEFITLKGDKILLTTEEKLYIYAAYRRNQGKAHIEKGGVVTETPKIITGEENGKKVIKEVQYQSDPVQLSETDMMRLADELTVEQKAYVQDMVEYLSVELAKKGNTVTNTLFGMDAYADKNYIPLTSDKTYLNSQAGISMDARIKRKAFTKPVVQNASNPIIAADFTKIWAQHLIEMSMYHSMVLPLEDFNRVWNYKLKQKTGEEVSVKNAIRKAYGPKANEYIKKFIEDLNGGIKQDAGGKLSNLLISKMKVDAVMGNLSVAIQQPSSIARAMVIIDPKYFGRAIFTKKSYEELIEHSPQAVLKRYGYFDVNMGRSLGDVVTEQELETPIEKIKAFFTDSNVRNEVFSWLPQKMDEISWTYMWNAVKEEINDTTKLKEGTEEYWNRVNERFKEVIDRSQVMDSVFQRSELMRSTNPLARIATNFMAEPTVSYNMLYDAITEFKKSGKKSAPYVARATGAVVSAIVLNSLLKSIITAGRDDDEEKKYGEKYVGAFVKNLLDDPAGMIPYVNSIVSTFRGYEPIRPDMQLFQNLYYAWKKIESDKYSVLEKILSLSKAIAPFFNVPLKNITKDIEMIWRNGHDVLESMGMIESNDTPANRFDTLKEKYPIIESGAATKAYYDLLYEVKNSGDTKTYNDIFRYLVKYGKKPDDIKKAMESRKDKKEVILDTDLEKSFIKAYKSGNRNTWKPLYDKLRAAGYTHQELLDLVK